MTEKYEPAVVKIRILQEGLEIGIGAGFFVSADGLLLTNFHVLSAAYDPALTIEINTKDGKKFSDFDYIKCQDDRKIDLCLIRLDYKPKSFFTPKKLSLRKGTDVLVLGHPRGYAYTLSTGIISGSHQEPVKKITNFDKNGKITSVAKKTIEYVQLTAPISPGNSGGPVFDDEGNLVGISTWVRVDQGSQNLNFAISANEIFDYLKGPTKGASFVGTKKQQVEAVSKIYRELNKKVMTPMITALDKGTDVNKY